MVSTGVYNGRIGLGGAADLVPGGSAAAMGVVRVAFSLSARQTPLLTPLITNAWQQRGN